MTHAQTKKKMNQFLDSFDEKITMHTEDGGLNTTHKSIDHKVGSDVEALDRKKQTTTKYSTVSLDDLSPEGRRIFLDYQRDGYAIVENFFTPKKLAKLQEDMTKVLE